MTIHDCIRFTSENPVCSLATTENGQPRVRRIGLWFADETGFYFQTSSAKEMSGQLQRNPKTELCFYKHAGLIGTMLRISGEVEFLEAPEWEQKVLNDRPFLNSFKLSEGGLQLVLFRIAHGEAHFWNMDNNLKPKEMIYF